MDGNRFDFVDVLIWLVVLAPAALMLWGLYLR